MGIQVLHLLFAPMAAGEVQWGAAIVAPKLSLCRFVQVDKCPAALVITVVAMVIATVTVVLAETGIRKLFMLILVT